MSPENPEKKPNQLRYDDPLEYFADTEIHSMVQQVLNSLDAQGEALFQAIIFRVEKEIQLESTAREHRNTSAAFLGAALFLLAIAYTKTVTVEFAGIEGVEYLVPVLFAMLSLNRYAEYRQARQSIIDNRQAIIDHSRTIGMDITADNADTYFRYLRAYVEKLEIDARADEDLKSAGINSLFRQ